MRPHRALNRRTPSVAYEERAKAKAHTLIHQPHWRIRTDIVDVRGHVTLRYLGKLRHLNVGWSYRGQSIRLYILDDVVTFATEDGEFIGETKIDPNRDYQPKGDGSESVRRFRPVHDVPTDFRSSPNGIRTRASTLRG